jgi:Arc/MetJ-type ribon-helix-helix transcriptional regulator
MAPKRKLTLLIDERIAAGIRSAVEDGAVHSQSALVEEAVTEYLVRKDREALRRAYFEAADDPLFIKDLEEVMADFHSVDTERWPT